ncbi:MAG: MBL fold metallo-hydrolase [Spirochaetaceae bacterium]|jgi:glyoxylase-like metal-dependent hydrolase (beta-lactamase superfamily II)|nr:MBL fold metallo-hydrolase [Spirochaetaceae bacterium]
MKIYFHINTESFSNCYLVTNEDTMQALIVDPCKISSAILEQIESVPYRLAGILVTHNHRGHTRGVKTLLKVYDTRVYTADYEVAPSYAVVLRNDGVIRVAGLEVNYWSVPGHSFSGMVYKIGSVLFTGDVLTSGTIGKTASKYAEQTLADNLKRKILTKDDTLTILPGHGPPSCIGVEKVINYNLQNKRSTD